MVSLSHVLTRAPQGVALSAAALVLSGPVAHAQQGPTVVKPASGGSVQASLRYGDGSQTELPVYSDLRISITRNGVPVAAGELLPAAARTSYFTAPRLLAVDLDDDSDPEVIVDVFTAGYDCCRRSVLLHYENGAYAPVVTDWGAGGYRLVNASGGRSPELLTSDARIPGMFGAGARGPLRVLAFRRGTLVDDSGRARPELRRDARLHRRALMALRKRRGGDRRAVLAAYVIDLARAGEARRAGQVLRDASSRGELRTTAAAFARRLDARLVAWGYATAPLLAPAARGR